MPAAADLTAFVTGAGAALAVAIVSLLVAAADRRRPGRGHFRGHTPEGALARCLVWLMVEEVAVRSAA